MLKRKAHALALLVQPSLAGLLLISHAYQDPSPLMTVAGALETIVAAALPLGVGEYPRRQSQRRPVVR